MLNRSSSLQSLREACERTRVRSICPSILNCSFMSFPAPCTGIEPIIVMWPPSKTYLLDMVAEELPLQRLSNCRESANQRSSEAALTPLPSSQPARYIARGQVAWLVRELPLKRGCAEFSLHELAAQVPPVGTIELEIELHCRGHPSVRAPLAVRVLGLSDNQGGER